MIRITEKEKAATVRSVFLALMFSLLATVPLIAGDYDGCGMGYYQVGAAEAKYLVCVPDNWNGDLVVFAHGYVSGAEAIEVIDYEIEGKVVSRIITDLGYAFATTSYRANGLVIQEAVEDVRVLIERFAELAGGVQQPRRVYLAGASEGGLVTALLTEKYPWLINGALAVCGPVGDFRGQIDFFGDFLVLFNYFFPGVLQSALGSPTTPTPVSMPDVIEDWDEIQLKVRNAIYSNPSATKQLLKVSKAPVDPGKPETVEQTVMGILWYNLYATNDAKNKLGGNPYDNSMRWFSGSNNDLLLNLRVQRFRADDAALRAMQEYQTSGRLSRPLVTLHTTADPIVPYWHETRYNLKTLFSGSLLRHLNLPVNRYGHCAFKENELLTGFGLLRLMAGDFF